MALYELHEGCIPKDLGEPVLVYALDGWIDAGMGAAAAMATLLESCETETIAVFDTDTLLDHRARRPVLRLEDGVSTSLTWPGLELRAGRDPEGESVLLLAGPEPDHQWRAFVDAVAHLVTGLRARMAVGLGAFPAPVPHTRSCRLASTAGTAALAQRVGFVPGTLEVPAGAQAVLERRLTSEGIPALGLWARVPHYVAAMPFPDASAALLDGLSDVAGIRVDTTELHRAARRAIEQIDSLVASNPDHIAMVRQLEGRMDEGDELLPGPGNLPSGDEIAAELEKFLRGER